MSEIEAEVWSVRFLLFFWLLIKQTVGQKYKIRRILSPEKSVPFLLPYLSPGIAVPKAGANIRKYKRMIPAQFPSPFLTKLIKLII